MFGGAGIGYHRRDSAQLATHIQKPTVPHALDPNTAAASRNSLGPARQKDLLRCVRQPDSPRAKEIDTQHEVRIAQSHIGDNDLGIAQDLCPDLQLRKPMKMSVQLL